MYSYDVPVYVTHSTFNLSERDDEKGGGEMKLENTLKPAPTNRSRP